LPDTPGPSPAGESDAAAETGSDLVRDDIDSREQEIVAQHETASAKLVHEIIRQRGIGELERTTTSLIWSAIGAGFTIGISLFAMAAIERAAPGSRALPLLLALGYAMGFVAVIAGRMQLFTESTITAVLPLATTPSWSNLWRTLRLWALVLSGNVLGTFLFALLVHYDVTRLPEISALIERQSAAAMTIYLEAPFWKGIPAGFLLAVAVWASPNLEKQELLLIVLFTGLMAIGEVAHSIVGSAEMWIAMLAGEVAFAEGIGGFLIPCALGNLVGGAVLFALLAHAQVVS
jgi:formate/nitrite transporter FocA (FNT family)